MRIEVLPAILMAVALTAFPHGVHAQEEGAPATGPESPTPVPTVTDTQAEQPADATPDPALVERAREAGTEIQTRTRRSQVGVEYGIAEGTVAASVDDVMEAITSYGSYASFMPNFRSSRVLSQRGKNALVYLEASALRDTLTVWAQMRMYARPDRGQTRIIEGRMRDGNLEHFVASWEVTPLDEGRTWVSFRVLFVPNLPFPNAIVTAENVRAARKTVRNLRRYLSAT